MISTFFFGGIQLQLLKFIENCFGGLASTRVEKMLKEKKRLKPGTLSDCSGLCKFTYRIHLVGISLANSIGRDVR